MDKPVEIKLKHILDLFNGEGPPVTVRFIYKWLGGTRQEFAIGANESFTDTPIWLSSMSEEMMQQATILEVINAPTHLKGEWKQVFDENKNVIVKYFPTQEEEEEMERLQKAHDETWEIALMCASL